MSVGVEEMCVDGNGVCLHVSVSELQKPLMSFHHNINTVPPAALICRVDPEDIQLLLIFLWVQAQEVLPVLVQVVDQVPIEAVLCDDVDRAWEQHKKEVHRRQSAG